MIQNIYFITFLFLISCNTPNIEHIRKEILKENPSIQIIDIFAGEGDSDSVYIHIKYIFNSQKEVKEEIWLFSRNADSKWQFSYKVL